jgi:hypothetical protein
VHPAAGHGAGRLVSLWLGEELQFDQSIPSSEGRTARGQGVNFGILSVTRGAFLCLPGTSGVPKRPWAAGWSQGVNLGSGQGDRVRWAEVTFTSFSAHFGRS